MLARLKRRLRSRGDRGATAVEMGLIIAGVGIAAIGGLTALNNALSGSFNDSATSEGTCVGSGCDPYTWTDDGIPAVVGMAFTTGYNDFSAYRNQAITNQTPVVSGALGTKTYAVSPALPTGVTLSTSTGLLSGTPTATMAATTYTVTVTDSGGAPSATDTFTMSVTNAPMVFTTGYTTINAVRNVAITNQTPVVSGALGTKTYAISPALPTGMSFRTTDGRISGTPTATQAATVHTVTVTDSGGAPSATATVTITVTQISFSTGYTAIVGQRGTAITPQTPVTTGGSGTKTYGISPALPSGLAFSTSTGQISGTPTGAYPATNHTVTVSDTSGSATTTVSVTVESSVYFTAGYTAITARRNVAITAQSPTIADANGSVTFTVSPALPAGLSLNPSTGQISGTPTATQTAASYTVTATDSVGSDTASVSITVTKVTFSTGYTNVSTFRGQSITAQTPSIINGSGSPNYEVTPALPAGLALDPSTGVLSGSPTVTSASTTYTVTVSDVTGSDSDTLTIAVAAPIEFSSGYTQIRAQRSTAITTQTPATTGGAGTKAYTISPALPAGLTINGTTGAISGTPTATQTATTHTVTVTDTSGTATTTVSITVQSALTLNNYTAIDCYIPPTGKTPQCGNLTRNPTVSNGYGTLTYSISGSLPAGLSFDTATGVISGTPTATRNPSVTRTITVTDSQGFTETGTISIRIRNN